MSFRNKRIAILNDSTKYGRLTIMQQPIVHTYSLGELYTERKEKGDPSLPILTVSIHAGVSEGELDEDKLGKKVKRITDKTQYKTARKGDLVFNMMRAWQGAIGVVRSDGLVSPAYIVAKPNEKIWPEYMDYCMKTPRMIHAIHRQSYGVTDFRLRLYWDSFTPITCQLPPLPEQQKIAAILSTQDKVIELKEKLLAQKQQQKKYLMQQLLTGKKRLSGFNEKWRFAKLENVSKYSASAASFKTYESHLGCGPYPVYDASGCFGNIDFYENEQPYISIVKDGAGAGRVALCKEKSSTIGTLGCIFANDIDLLYLFYCMSAVDFQIYSNGSTIPHVYYKDYKNMVLYLPCELEQKAIVEILSAADHEIDLLQKSIEAEKQKKKALMQLLLT